jgi:hypothetical protein
MFLRLRHLESGKYFVIDVASGTVYAGDFALAERALASAREYAKRFARAVPGNLTLDGAFEVRGPVTRAEQAELAAGRPIPQERTALQLHLDFFDLDLDGSIALAESFAGWRGLGFALFPALLKTALSAIFFGRAARRRYSGTTGIFDAQGRIDGARLREYLAEFHAAGGSLSFEDTIALLNRKSARGFVSRRQFGSLFEVCRRLNNAEIITQAQFKALFDGSLLWRAASMTNRAGRRARWLQPAAAPASAR